MKGEIKNPEFVSFGSGVLPEYGLKAKLDEVYGEAVSMFTDVVETSSIAMNVVVTDRSTGAVNLIHIQLDGETNAYQTQSLLVSADPMGQDELTAFFTPPLSHLAENVDGVEILDDVDHTMSSLFPK